MSEQTVQIRTSTDSATITDLAALAEEIAEMVGFSCADAPDPAESEHLNADGAWEYHFETNSRWGFVAGRPDEMVTTTYPGWNTLVIEPDHAAVFYAGTLVGIISRETARIGWYARPLGGGPVPITDLETAMLAAFRAEHDALTEQPTAHPSGDPPHGRD